MSRWRLNSGSWRGADLGLELSPAGLSPLPCCLIKTDPGELLPHSHPQARSLLPWRGTEAAGSTLGPPGKHPRAPWHRAGHRWQGKVPIHSSACQGSAWMHKDLPKFRSGEDSESVGMPANVVTIHTLQVRQKGSFTSQRLLHMPGHIVNAPSCWAEASTSLSLQTNPYN